MSSRAEEMIEEAAIEGRDGGEERGGRSTK